MSTFGSPELWFVLLLFALVSVPVFIGVIVFLNRRLTPRHQDEELEALKERVEELESERDS